ncbi:TPA: protein-export chaperone SecB, partial [Staphylococcus pseudintermedius]|nr:protein-export chaperone SecB [Staphylococcus pseudintermedius]
AIAILFPYLRSLISDVTSKGSRAPIILPPINVHEFLDNAEKSNH